MDTHALALCFDFKHNELGSHLIDFEGKTVKDCTGNLVLCEGSWNDPGDREHCLPAVQKLCGNHRQVGNCVPA